MPFSDAIDLRSHLANILQPYLGEWEDGSPRIHIIPPRSKMTGKAKADTTTQSELECIIRRRAEGNPEHMSGGQRKKIAVYQFELINFADDTKLSQAISVLEVDSLMSFARPFVHLDADRSLGLPEQATFYPQVFQVLNQVVYSA